MTPAKTRDIIEDFGALVQTSILLLGDTPRLPRRLVEDGTAALALLPVETTVEGIRRRRTRHRLSCAVAEGLLPPDEDAAGRAGIAARIPRRLA